MQSWGLWLILNAVLDLSRARDSQSHQRAHMADMTLAILIGDAQPRVRFGLHVLLEEQPGWRVAGEAVDAPALLDEIRGGCPDLVLLDWELPGMPAEELLATIRRACPDLRVIFMSGEDELRGVALRAGADVFAYKADPPEKLLRLIRELTAVKVA